MSYFGSKPDYNRRTIKERLYKLKFKFQDYEDFDFDDIVEWCNKVSKKTKDLDQKILIDIDNITEDDGGCGSGIDYIAFVPFYERKENDEEYNKRIAKEEKEYNEYLEIKKKEREQNAEYLRDLEEYRRIKNKYHF